MTKTIVHIWANYKIREHIHAENSLILNRSLDFLLYTKKETNSVLFTTKYRCYHIYRSVLQVRAIQLTFR